MLTKKRFVISNGEGLFGGYADMPPSFSSTPLYAYRYRTEAKAQAAIEKHGLSGVRVKPWNEDETWIATALQVAAVLAFLYVFERVFGFLFAFWRA